MWAQVIARYSNRTFVSNEVKQLMVERREFGLRKYGVPVRISNGRDPRIDMAAELLDGIVYAEQCAEQYPEFAAFYRRTQDDMLAMIHTILPDDAIASMRAAFADVKPLVGDALSKVLEEARDRQTRGELVVRADDGPKLRDSLSDESVAALEKAFVAHRNGHSSMLIIDNPGTPRIEYYDVPQMSDEVVNHALTTLNGLEQPPLDMRDPDNAAEPSRGD